MRAYVQRDSAWDMYDVCFVVDSGNQTYQAEIVDGRLKWNELDRFAKMTPALKLPPEALKAFIDASEDHVPNDRAQEAHLKDAIKVRDTLLSIVDRGVV